MTKKLDIYNLKVGDVVGFKYDVEQYAPILEIRYNRNIRRMVYVVESTDGGYAHGRIELTINDIWVD